VAQRYARISGRDVWVLALALHSKEVSRESVWQFLLVQSNLNQVGQNISKIRRRQDWTPEEVVAKLELIGCQITPEILAEIETGRCVVTDACIAIFSEVFSVSIKDLFPSAPQSGNRKTLQTKRRVTLTTLKRRVKKRN
jgi:hypothetical protein